MCPQIIIVNAYFTKNYCEFTKGISIVILFVRILPADLVAHFSNLGGSASTVYVS